MCRRKFLVIIFALLAFLVFIPCEETRAEEYTAEGLKMELNGSGTEYTVYYGHCTDLAVTIPASFNGKPVTSIGERAFAGQYSLTGITIPSGTSIGAEAFKGCERLTDIQFDGISTVAEDAFADFSSLPTAYVLKDSETETWVAEKGLPYVSFEADGENYKVSTCSENVTSVNIPGIFNGRPVTSIGVEAFYYCTGLTSVTIPSSVTSIGNNAFKSCTSLTSVTIPSSVTSINAGTFRGCAGLTSITIPSSVTDIGSYAFRGCTGLTSITIPSSVTDIGSYAFDSCTGLTSITIPSSVTGIGGYAFDNCTGLTSIQFDGSLAAFEGSTFCGCSNLNTAYVPKDSGARGWRWAGTMSYVFFEADGENYSVCNCTTNAAIVTVPSTFNGRPVTKVKENAFEGCASLSSINIPTSITSIGDNAFNACSESLTIRVKEGSPAHQWAIANSIAVVVEPNPNNSSGNNNSYIPSGIIYYVTPVETDFDEEQNDNTETVENEEKSDTEIESSLITREDGSTIETTVETTADGTITKTVNKVCTDGSTYESKTVTKKNGTVIRETKKVSANGAYKESRKVTEKGKITEVIKKVNKYGTITDTKKVTKKDGSKTETVVKTKKDGSKTETVVKIKKDGSKSEKVVKTTKSGKTTKKTIYYDAAGNIIKIK